jgi:hypothetical protein
MKEQERNERNEKSEVDNTNKNNKIDKNGTNGGNGKEDSVQKGAPITPRKVRDVEGEIDEHIIKLMQQAISNVVIMRS